MKALTLTQPWASLVAMGAKTIETRSWGTKHRGPIAIHAAKGLGPVGGMRGLRALVGTEPFYEVLCQDTDLRTNVGLADMLPRGAVVAVASTEAVYSTETARLTFAAPGTNERAFGNYADGRYAWVLRAIEALPEPVPCSGALGLWPVPKGIL